MAESEFMPIRTVQVAIPTILVVANYPKFLTFLDMALKLEFECEVLSITRGRSAVETAERVKPDLFIIDYHFLDLGALELSHRLHDIEELESVPTIFLDSPVTSWNKPQRYHTTFLSMPFALENFYAAVNMSLGRT
jgi:PleD family two-component response regulator